MTHDSLYVSLFMWSRLTFDLGRKDFYDHMAGAAYDAMIVRSGTLASTLTREKMQNKLETTQNI